MSAEFWALVAFAGYGAIHLGRGIALWVLAHKLYYGRHTVRGWCARLPLYVSPVWAPRGRLSAKWGWAMPWYWAGIAVGVFGRAVHVFIAEVP